VKVTRIITIKSRMIFLGLMPKVIEIDLEIRLT